MDFLNVLAHGGEEVLEVAGPTLDEVIRSNSVKFSLLAGGLILILTIFSILLREKSEWLKYLLFGGFIVAILANTIYLSASTIYLNQVSKTGGPVHWHADFEIYSCGQKIDLKDPKGLSNKIGTEVVHEHNDDRIHIEGVILDEHQANLGHFFESIGGSFDGIHLTVPTNEGTVTLEDGMVCPDGKVGELGVFVYKVINDKAKVRTFYQQKLNIPKNYVISPESKVPPGDCIIFEFGPQKDRTDKLCNQYRLGVQKGEIYER